MFDYSRKPVKWQVGNFSNKEKFKIQFIIHVVDHDAIHVEIMSTLEILIEFSLKIVIVYGFNPLFRHSIILSNGY